MRKFNQIIFSLFFTLACLVPSITQAQLKVLPQSAGNFGSRVNISGETVDSEGANLSILSKTHAKSLLIEHKNLDNNSNLTTPRIGLEMKYVNTAQPFTGYKTLIDVTSAQIVRGSNIRLVQRGAGQSDGIFVDLVSKYDPNAPAPPFGTRNSIGINALAAEIPGALAIGNSYDYLAAYSGTIDHRFRRRAFATKLLLQNGGTPTNFETYGLHVSQSFFSRGDAATIGIYSRIDGASNHAAHFTGNVLVNGQLINSSDRSLKRNIIDVLQPIDILSSLRPHRYEMIDVSEEQAGQQHYGFVAQEVEEVLPDLIHNFVEPAVLDSLGNVISPKRELKAVRYLDFIAILTAATQEQQSVIDGLSSRVSELEEELLVAVDQLTNLAECTDCIIDLGGLGLRQTEEGDKTGKSDDKEKKRDVNTPSYRLYPNPASNFFTVEADTSGAFTTYLYAPNGQLVLSTATIRSRVSIDTYGLAAGTYIVKIVSETGRVTSQQLTVAR